MSYDRAELFFEKAYCNFRMAENNAGAHERFYKIANFTVCLRFAGDALLPKLTAAFEHLAIHETDQPDLTICLADNESTNFPFTLPNWTSSDCLPRGEIGTYSNNNIVTIYNFHTGCINLINLKTNTAIFWAKSLRYVPWWISGSPLQRIINVWMMRKGLQLTHAGAVGTNNGGVLIAGKGGSGKSTTSLSCVEHGLSYVSEDYCLVRSAPEPYAYSVYNSAKLEANTMKMFPHLESKTSNPNRQADEKAFLFLDKIYPKQMTTGFPIRAVFLPRITGGDTTSFSRASIVDGLLALTPSTFFQLSNCDKSTLALFKTLLEQVPCYHLNLGSNLTEVSETISDFIDEAKVKGRQTA